MSEFYTPQEIGARLQLKTRTVHAHAIRGLIPGARKFVGLWRFDAAIIDAWLHPPIPVIATSAPPAAKLAALERFK